MISRETGRRLQELLRPTLAADEDGALTQKPSFDQVNTSASTIWWEDLLVNKDSCGDIRCSFVLGYFQISDGPSAEESEIERFSPQVLYKQVLLIFRLHVRRLMPLPDLR